MPSPPLTPTQQTLLEKVAPVLARNPTASLGELAAQARVGRAKLYQHFVSHGALL